MVIKKLKDDQKTIGAHARDLMLKGDEKINPIDMQRAAHAGMYSDKSYEEEVFETLKRGLDDPKIEGDFYIVVWVKRERHMKNVVRNLFYYRQSCPSPQYDQTVYAVDRASKHINFLWVVPDIHSCDILLESTDILPKDHAQLLQFVREFKSGALLKKAMRLNKEFDN